MQPDELSATSTAEQGTQVLLLLFCVLSWPSKFLPIPVWHRYHRNLVEGDNLPMLEKRAPGGLSAYEMSWPVHLDAHISTIHFHKRVQSVSSLCEEFFL